MKKSEKLARAAAARALLGLDDDESAAPAQPVVPSKPVRERVERAADDHDRVPVSKGARRVAKVPVRAPDEPKPQAAASGERPQVLDGEPDPLAPWKSPIAEKHWPKKHAHGSLKRCDSVWYRGERYWIEYANDHWSKGVYVRIVNRAVRPAPFELPSDGGGNVLTFCVHADCLDLAPVGKNPFTKQPSQADVARKERTAKGAKDVGDPVAVHLREAKTLDDVYKIGSKYLEVQLADLKKKYAHLNPGQQRMVIGNRMRAKWKKEGGHV